MQSTSFSRRTLLTGLGAGLLGSTMLPGKARAQALNTTEASLLWKTPLPEGYALWGDSTYANGSIILNMRRGQGRDEAQSSLFWLDIQTHKYSRGPLLLAELGFTGYAKKPVLVNNVLYVPYPRLGLFALDANTAQTLWLKNYDVAGDVSALNARLIVFPTRDGQIVAVDLDGNKVWSQATGESPDRSTAPAININGAIVCALNGVLCAVDQSGNRLWKFTGTRGAVVSQLASGSGNIYFTDGNTLYAVDANNGKVTWQKSIPYTTVSPRFDGATVYLCWSNGDFQAFRADDGAKLWSLNLGTRANTMYLEDSVAYLGCAGFGNKICAVDLPSKGQQVVSYSPGFNLKLIGLENGVCYFIDSAAQNVYAVNLANQLHQYFCESQLMADDYITSDKNPAGYQPSSTWYRTNITLQDPASAPRVNKSIKVSVSDSATVMALGRTYQVTPAAPLWLTTDAAGQLSLAVLATDLSCPSLSLWGNFMDPQEAIVVYPDHDINGSLAQVQANDLSTATTFDGSSMLPAGYSTADALAASIQQVMGNVPVSLLQAPGETLSVAQTKYIAYPDTSPDMVYQRVAGSTDRTYKPGTASAWSLQISTNGTASYNPSVAMDALPISAAGIADIKIFIKNVVHGAEKLAYVVWTVEKNVAQAVLRTASNTYNLAITKFEHAFSVAAGILKTVIGDIRKAIEWLSYVLNWNDILKTKNEITDLFNGWLTSMQTQSSGALKQLQATVDKALTGAEGNIQQIMNSALALLGSTSVESAQVAHNNPLAIVGAEVKHWYPAMQWLPSKFNENLSKFSLSKEIPSSYGPFVRTFDNLVKTVTNKISADPTFKDLSHVLDGFITRASALFADPEAAIKRPASDLVRLVGDVAVLFLKVIQVTIDTVLQAIPSLFEAVRDFMNQQVDLPGILGIWKAISRSSLTLLDLGALMVAVPATIIKKAKGVNVESYPGEIPTLLAVS